MSLPKTRITFNLKVPKAADGRKSFSILKRVIQPDGESKYKKVNSDRIDAINLALTNGGSFDRLHLQAKDVVADLYKEAKAARRRVVYNQDNQALLDQYWEKEYSDRDLINPKAMYHDLQRAVEGVGMLSLLSASKDDLQSAVNSKWTGNKQRRKVDRLNTLLKHLGRTIKLRKVRKVYAPVKYLNQTDIIKAVTKIEDPAVKALCMVSFTTGMRIGEVFAIRPSDVKGNFVNVVAQVDDTGVRRETKTRRERKAFIFEGGKEAIEQWLAVAPKKKVALRKKKYSSIVSEACAKVWPSDEEKWLCFHDLRHSHAIHLLNNGVSLSLVALALGNSIKVCQEYYAGFSLTSDSIEAIEAILKKA